MFSAYMGDFENCNICNAKKPKTKACLFCRARRVFVKSTRRGRTAASFHQENVIRGHETLRVRREAAQQENRDLAAAAKVEPPSNVIPLLSRPRTRADCERVSRPCNFVSCRHNLFLDISRRGVLQFSHPPDVEPDQVPANLSCALDVAEQGGMVLDRVGEILGLTRERIRQIEIGALVQLKKDEKILSHRPESAKVHELMAEPDDDWGL